MRIQVTVVLLFCALETVGIAAESRKHIVVIAGMKSHGPEGNGIHDYGWSARLIKTVLENSNIRERLRVSTFLTGWPAYDAALSDADTIMVISDGRDGDLGREALHLETSARVRQVDALIARGCGLVTFHFSTFAPDELGEKALDWYGGYFDWETDGRREWYSSIKTMKAVVSPASPQHPILRGVKPFKIHEEFYYDIRFRDGDRGWSPLWTVDALPAANPKGAVVAWAVERSNGSRGFATTCGHFYENWKEDGFRKTILNALAWTAHMEVPDDGVSSEYYSHAEIVRHLQHPDALPANSVISQADKEAYDDEPYWYQPGHPLRPAEARAIKTLPGFQVDKVFDVPQPWGSWTAITIDHQGRLVCAAQHKPGIFRLTLSGNNQSPPRVERLSGVAEQVGWSHALLYAFDSLYVTVSEENELAARGVYRLTDTDGDDQFDVITHIVKLDASGEHGAHSLVVSPDGRSLYMMCGNGTQVPDAMMRRMPSTTQGIDHLMPPGFESSEYTTGGFVIRFNPDGSHRQLVCGGLRNSFDLAFNRRGDLFTFDSDMEWDLGAPWYRPTRVCHLVSGGEFGWREDAAKWPVYFEDSVAPVLNVGPGSPSGIAFGDSAKFPAKYQHALFLCDWTFATIHAVHLEPRGASYRATIEEFVGGNGLPVTDLTIGADGAMYFVVGGRRLGSAVYRVSYVGNESVAPAAWPQMEQSTIKLHSIRQRLETFHGRRDPQAIDTAWPYLGHEDRAIRFAARVAVEAQPVNWWRRRALEESHGLSQVVGLLALARKDESGALIDVVGALNTLDLNELSAADILVALRAYELALARGADQFGARQKAKVWERLRPQFPHSDARVNRELVRLLCYLGDPSAIDAVLDYMASDLGERPALGSGYFVRNPKYGQAVRDILQVAPLVDRMHAAQMLLWIDDKWTKDQRSRYFKLIADAQQNTKGGYWYGEFWDRIGEVALEQTPRAWREELDVNANAHTFADSELPTPEGPGKEWTLPELLEAVQIDFRDREFENGRKMFAAAKCISCHRVHGEGNATGPDLSSIGQRFTIRDILDSTLHPSKAISDQYRVTMLTTDDGRTITDRVVSRTDQKLTIATNLNRPSQTTTVEIETIEAEHVAPISTMPEGLLNALNLDEVLDLLAYLVSGASEQHPVFTGHP